MNTENQSGSRFPDVTENRQQKHDQPQPALWKFRLLCSL